MVYSTLEIKNKIWNKIKDYFYVQRAHNPLFVRNINYDGLNSQPKVLICYLEKGYFTNVEINIRRTIYFEIFKIVKVFSELGYCIDLINCNDTKAIELISDAKYHVIFGFGEAFYQITELQPEAISILYMTEHHPVFSYQEEKKRVDYFYARHKKNVSLKRSGMFYKPEHLEKKYTHVLTLSETEPLKDQYDNPYTIFPTGIINRNFKYNNKNHLKSGNKFLWLGSSGVIHKGLDILLDVFSQRTDIELHICGMTSEDMNILSIPEKENIFAYGHVNINSDLFQKLTEECTYIILLSCSEGCATSVLTGMLHGLIPIVMRNAGFNRLGENAIFLDDFKIEYVDLKLTELIQINVNELEIFSKKVFEFAHSNFTLNTFEKSFRSIVSNILVTDQVDSTLQ